MRIADTSIRIPSMRFVTLKWVLRDPDPSFEGVRIEVFRSQDSSVGERITELPGSADRAIDRNPPTWRFWQPLHYTIRATGDSTAEARVSAQEPPGDTMALAAADQLRMFLRSPEVGRKCYHLPRKQFGDRCSECWDAIRQRKITDRCETCFGTGFLAGYGTPEEVFISLRVDKQLIEQAGFTQHQESSSACWLTNHPDLSQDDLIVEPENRRWRVIQVKDIEKRRTTFRQIALLDEIERDQVEYQIPVEAAATWS